MNNAKTDKIRVAVYIRIGGTGEYETAFESQKAHFSKTINQNPEWELVEIYADLGADSRKQPNLGRLMADCRAGRIDLVVTKSTSRISRSMNALMSVVRELAYLKPPVGVYFEDTKLNTLSKDSFLFLSLFEAMAIHESDAKVDQIPYVFLTKHMRMRGSLRKRECEEEDSDYE